MENKKTVFMKINLLFIVLIIATMLLWIILPANQIALAEESTSENWNYPSTWTKIGGDQDYKTIMANAVYSYETAPENSNAYQSTGNVHSSIDIEDIQAAGEPNIMLRRTFLKGYFENSWYIAILVDVIMDPSNNYESSTRIRSANIQIDTQLFKANKVGSTLVTYWPTETFGGYIAEGAPINIPDTISESVSVSVGASVGQNNSITSSFTVSYQNSIPRLMLYSDILTADGKSNGYHTKFLYYKPNEANVPYTESSSMVKYCAIYRCDENIDYYDLRVIAEGQFYYKSSSGSTAIARSYRYEDFFIKPSTNFFKTYYID